MNTLHLVVRDRNGRIGQEAIGEAIIAEIDRDVRPSALQNGLLALAVYLAHSSRQAAAAMRVLADLGDVDFEESDFRPRWFKPNDGVATVDRLLQRARNPFPAAVRSELVLLRRALEEANSRGYNFCLVELEPGERLGFEGHRLIE